MNNIKIRKIKIQDFEQGLKIYNHYIENSFSNFEEKKFTLQKFKKLVFDNFSKKIPFLVAEIDKKIVGIAYLTEFRSKSGYKYAFENTIYIHSNFIGQGVGNKLLKSLLSISKKNRMIKTIIAVICGYKNSSSISIHKKYGFKKIGTLKKVGFKKNKWLDAVYMQKII